MSLLVTMHAEEAGRGGIRSLRHARVGAVVFVQYVRFKVDAVRVFKCPGSDEATVLGTTSVQLVSRSAMPSRPEARFA